MALSTWVPEAETKPAPMPLLLVQSFVNTWEGHAGTDRLGDAVQAGRWLAAAGLQSDAPLDETDVGLVQQFREGVRALLVGNAGGISPGVEELAALRALAERTRLRPVLGDDGAVALVADGTGVARALARLLVVIRDAQRDGTWVRLKACRNPDCRWAYYDRSHAARGAWCDMAVCGNRIKNRNLRSRRAAMSHLAAAR